MVDQKFVDYIRRLKEAGFDNDKIKAYLEGQKYGEDMINNAIAEAEKKPNQAQGTPQQTQSTNIKLTKQQTQQIPGQKKPGFTSTILIIVIFAILVLLIGGYYLTSFFSGEGAEAFGIETGLETEQTTEESESEQIDAIIEEIEETEEPVVEKTTEENITETVEEVEEIAEEEPIEEEVVEEVETTPVSEGAYVNEQIKISFDYPDSWNLVEKEFGKSVILNLPVGNSYLIDNDLKISSTKLSGSINTIDTFTEYIRNTLGLVGATNSVTVGGKPGKLIAQTITTTVGTSTVTKKAELYTVLSGENGYYFYYLAVDSDYNRHHSDVENLIKNV